MPKNAASVRARRALRAVRELPVATSECDERRDDVGRRERDDSRGFTADGGDGFSRFGGGARARSSRLRLRTEPEEAGADAAADESSAAYPGGSGKSG